MVTNLVCAPPSDTPAMLYGEDISSDARSSRTLRAGVRNSVLSSSAVAMSNMASMGCLFSIRATSSTVLPMYCSNSGRTTDSMVKSLNEPVTTGVWPVSYSATSACRMAGFLSFASRSAGVPIVTSRTTSLPSNRPVISPKLKYNPWRMMTVWL